MLQPDMTKEIRLCEFAEYDMKKEQWIPCKEIATGERNIGKHFAEYYRCCDKHKKEQQ